MDPVGGVGNGVGGGGGGGWEGKRKLELPRKRKERGEKDTGRVVQTPNPLQQVSTVIILRERRVTS